MRADLRRWILKRAQGKPVGDFSDQTALLETGVLSSLDVVELVLFLENLRGSEVDVDRIEPESLRSIDALYENFLRLPG